jgi:hypothetical protein
MNHWCPLQRCGTNAISIQVQGLRETLEGEASEDEESAEDVESGNSMATIFFQQNNLDAMSRTIPVPTPHERTRLLELYHSRVDSVYKLLHWPTVVASINAAHAYTSSISSSAAAQALEYSIYFMALCSITEHEAEEMGFGKRQETTQAYRLATETLLTRANLCLNPDLIVLQAFVIYLVSSVLVSSSSIASASSTNVIPVCSEGLSSWMKR